MIIKLITHKRNKDGTVILYLDKGLTQEDRHELMDLEGKPLELKVKSVATSDYVKGFEEGLKEGWNRFYNRVLEVEERGFPEDGCQT